MKYSISLILLLISLSLSAQDNPTLALEKAKEAIKLMDNGQIDESILLLKESTELDPKNSIFPYEIAYAYTLKKDYEQALSYLKKAKKLPNANSQVYQMSGNCYSYLGNAKKALKEYEEGLKKFPDSGNLYLERGNIFLIQKNYAEAIKNYQLGIKVDPMFSSNYYRLALLYLQSKDKLGGLLYGEIFMNIERTTQRTQEMSKLLYETYQESITFKDNEVRTNFCEIVLDAQNVQDQSLELPLCAIYGKNLLLSIIGQKEVNLNSLAEIRANFIQNFFKEDYKNYPNVLFQYQKKMQDQGVFEAYNHYLFQMGAAEEFEVWKKENEAPYDRFIQWYTQDENILRIEQENLFIHK